MRLLRERRLSQTPSSSPRSGAARARLVTALLVVLAGCTSERAPQETPAVAASIFPLYDIARRVAGPQAAVALVLPAGRMDHTFEPRPQDLVRLARVELALGVGLGLDPWLRRVLDAATDGRARVEEIGPGLDPRPIPDHVLALVEEESASPGGATASAPGGPVDPHVLLDPRRMAQAVPLIAEALAAHDPEGTVGYRARAMEVRKQIEALDAELRTRAEGWKNKTIVTFHGSFFYFADAYGLTVAAVVEPLPGREPSPRYVARVVEAIRKSGASAIFTEPQLDPAPARVIAAEAGLPLFELDPIGGGPGASSYEALLRKNAAVLDEALR